jgi:tetraacyldisaccharide 4'-kinase
LNLKVLEVAYRLQGPAEEAGLKALAFAGLANPESFRSSISQDTGYELLDFVSVPDHYAYSAADIERILQRGRELGVQVYLTTEKDWTKIRNLVSDHSQFRVLELKTFFLGGAEEFHADLDQVVN